MGETDQTRPTQDSCPDCHALVADLEAHKEWHRRVIADLATAVEKEIDRKTMTGTAAPG